MKCRKRMATSVVIIKDFSPPRWKKVLIDMEYLITIFFVVMILAIALGTLCFLGCCLFASTGNFMD